MLSLHAYWLELETYVNDAAKSSLLLPQLVLHGQVSQQQQLLLDALVLRRGDSSCGRPALIRATLSHFGKLY